MTKHFIFACCITLAIFSTLSNVPAQQIPGDVSGTLYFKGTNKTLEFDRIMMKAYSSSRDGKQYVFSGLDGYDKNLKKRVLFSKIKEIKFLSWTEDRETRSMFTKLKSTTLQITTRIDEIFQFKIDEFYGDTGNIFILTARNRNDSQDGSFTLVAEVPWFRHEPFAQNEPKMPGLVIDKVVFND